MSSFTIGDLRRYVASIPRADEGKQITVVDANTAEHLPVMWVVPGHVWSGRGSTTGIAIGVETPDQD